MNRFVSLLSAILLAVGAHAQIEIFTAMDLEKGEPCDTARYVVYYNMTCVTDTNPSARTFVDDIMRLELGDRVHYFYSYKAYQADSANAVIMANGGNSFTGGGSITWRLYKNYPTAGKTSLLEKFGMDRFVCTEDYAAPLWQPVADSSAVIIGYPCSLAVTPTRGALGTHGMPKTYRLMPGRGSSAACPDSSCAPTTRKGIMCSTPPAWRKPLPEHLYIIKVESTSRSAASRLTTSIAAITPTRWDTSPIIQR